MNLKQKKVGEKHLKVVRVPADSEVFLSLCCRIGAAEDARPMGRYQAGGTVAGEVIRSARDRVPEEFFCWPKAIELISANGQKWVAWVPNRKS